MNISIFTSKLGQIHSTLEYNNYLLNKNLEILLNIRTFTDNNIMLLSIYLIFSFNY